MVTILTLPDGEPERGSEEVVAELGVQHAVA